MGRAITAVEPNARAIGQANRAFLGRAVRLASAAGVRQFLDIGSGIPTQGNVHEVAQQAGPAARVVYLDVDPGLVTIPHWRPDAPVADDPGKFWGGLVGVGRKA